MTVNGTQRIIQKVNVIVLINGSGKRNAGLLTARQVDALKLELYRIMASVFYEVHLFSNLGLIPIRQDV